jgi:predicted GNAT superfamily acetyltransferase
MVTPTTFDPVVAAEEAGVTIRELDTVAGCAAASEVFEVIWGYQGGFPVELLRAIQHTGGYLTGAYRGPEMIGASFGFHTPHGLHSHVTGVTTSDRGVGLALKLHQRRWAAERGIDTISWTFDPLVRRNVVFNLGKLAATVEEYLPDFYGSMPDAVNRGDTSDRLLVSWSTTELRIPVRFTEPPAGSLVVEVPDNIEQIRLDEPNTAAQWRLAIREQLGGAMAEGFRVIGLTGVGSYVLDREATS